MKYSIISNLEFSVPAHQDALHNGVLSLTAGKPNWGEVVVRKTETLEGSRAHQVDIRFHNRLDMDDLFDYIRDRMEHIPVLRGSVSKHVCHHDTDNRPCTIEEQYTKE